MTRRAIAGKKRARRRGNAPRVTQREVDSAAASYHNMLMAYGENNMATQRAEWAYRDLQRRYAEQKAQRATRRGNVRPDHDSQMKALSGQIDQAMQKRDFKRVRDLQTKIQRLYSKSVGGLRKGPARYRGSRGNPGKFTFKTQSLGVRGALGVIFRDGVNVETVGPIQSFKGEHWSAKEDKAAAAAAARDRIRDLKQLEGTSWQAGPSYRGNPAEAARAVSEEFHGRAVREMVPVTERRHYHKFLAELGELTLLVIHTPDGRHRVELTEFAGAMLTTNEKKNQLFITGGDQSVNLRDFGIRDPHEKEHLGELRKIAYYTDKEHLGDEGGEADYHHSFSKPYPHVDFYTRDTHLEIFGGRYKITREGIVG